MPLSLLSRVLGSNSPSTIWNVTAGWEGRTLWEMFSHPTKDKVVTAIAEALHLIKMPCHPQNRDLRLPVLMGQPVRKEDFFNITQVLYCIHFPSGLCRAKVLLLNLLLFYSKTCWAVRAQGGLKWQRMSWPPKMFGTVWSSMGSSSARAVELGSVCAPDKWSKRLFLAGCWTD